MCNYLVWPLLDCTLHTNGDYLEQFSHPTTAQCFPLFRSNLNWLLQKGERRESRSLKKVQELKFKLRWFKLSQHGSGNRTPMFEPYFSSNIFSFFKNLLYFFPLPLNPLHPPSTTSITTLLPTPMTPFSFLLNPLIYFQESALHYNYICNCSLQILVGKKLRASNIILTNSLTSSMM